MNKTDGSKFFSWYDDTAMFDNLRSSHTMASNEYTEYEVHKNQNVLVMSCFIYYYVYAHAVPTKWTL